MTDLATIMASDPHNHTDQDIDKIIEVMREARKQFKAGNMQAGSTKPKTEKQKQASSLKDLVGDL